MLKVQKILVPMDFSSCSRRALNDALDLARQLDAKIEILHVWQPPHFEGGEPRIASESGTTSLAEHAVVLARAEMDRLIAALPAGDRARITTVVEVGNPHQRIVERANREGHDLIAMGTHGRTGRAHSLVGSVAESVVRLASCPVLTIRES